MSRLTVRFITAYLTASNAMSPSGLISRHRRGATFIEYAILAAIAVLIGLIIQNFLAGSGGWISKMLNLLNNNTLGSQNN